MNRLARTRLQPTNFQIQFCGSKNEKKHMHKTHLKSFQILNKWMFNWTKFILVSNVFSNSMCSLLYMILVRPLDHKVNSVLCNASNSCLYVSRHRYQFHCSHFQNILKWLQLYYFSISMNVQLILDVKTQLNDAKKMFRKYSWILHKICSQFTSKLLIT